MKGLSKNAYKIWKPRPCLQKNQSFPRDLPNFFRPAYISAGNFFRKKYKKRIKWRVKSELRWSLTWGLFGNTIVSFGRDSYFFPVNIFDPKGHFVSQLTPRDSDPLFFWILKNVAEIILTFLTLLMWVRLSCWLTVFVLAID